MGAIKLTMAGTYLCKIGGANFLHCWATDSIWLKHAESLITKQYNFYLQISEWHYMPITH